ncbi:hypothetical protein FACS1894162_5910 [Bacteroidia bacterium]|nr:hypothetical protein FACS1894162_5910 [Bacteroidia bacterium]
MAGQARPNKRAKEQQIKKMLIFASNYQLKSEMTNFTHKKQRIMMKHVKMFSLFSLIVLSSCADELYPSKTLSGSGRDISFKTFADKQLRASVTTASSMTSFTTSAWSHPAGSPYDGYVLNGVTVTRGEEDGAGVNNWEYFPKASWPATGKVDFFAYSPASSVNVTTGLKKDVSSVTIPPATGPEIQYTVPRWDGDSQVDRQEDFLVTKSVDLAFDPLNPTVQLNFKHALSRIVFKAQNQNENKTYVIKELALSNLKSKGTLNMLDSLPNAAADFLHVAGAYNISWKAQHDSVTYKVDLGSTNVLVPYGTGTASSDYTAITNASNGLMVLPQETVLGAFTGSTPEYGTVAEIAATPADASYLYATVAEVDYLTNDTVNRRQVVFRLHDPANKAQGIVFEAGKQYTFLLTLGLDGGVITFSVPSVADFYTLADADVDLPEPTPWKCGDLINGYTTANYASSGILNDLCWTTQNISEGTAAATSYDPGGANSTGRGWYYTSAQAVAACNLLGAEWSVPTDNHWQALSLEFGTLTGGIGTTGSPATLQSLWNYAAVLAGTYDDYTTAWLGWGSSSLYWSRTTYPNWDVTGFDTPGSGWLVARPAAPGDLCSVRCVRDM